MFSSLNMESGVQSFAHINGRDFTEFHGSVRGLLQSRLI